MTKQSERRPVVLDDDENHRLHAIWSRSGKRLIVTVHDRSWQADRFAQVELRPDQVEELIGFLSKTVASASADR